MAIILPIVGDITAYAPLISTIALVVAIYLIFTLSIGYVTGALKRRAKTKKQFTNIGIFSRLLTYLFFVVLAIIALFAYVQDWSSLGIWLGLFSAALGWALQQPITGIAGWIMVVAIRPFDVGDRIFIGNMRGDVVDISLTHIYLAEVGGIVNTEENSGRIIMIPNSLLFTQNIINYTSKQQFTLDEVSFLMTFESDVDEAGKIALESAREITKEFMPTTKTEPYLRTFFDINGVSIRVRYQAPPERVQEISSTITKTIFEKVKKSKNVHFSYVHNIISWDAGKRIPPVSVTEK